MFVYVLWDQVWISTIIFFVFETSYLGWKVSVTVYPHNVIRKVLKQKWGIYLKLSTTVQENHFVRILRASHRDRKL